MKIEKNNPKTILITQEEYDELKRDQLWSEALSSAGVDNWDGFDYAQDIYHDLLEENGYE